MTSPWRPERLSGGVGPVGRPGRTPSSNAGANSCASRAASGWSRRSFHVRPAQSLDALW